MIRIMIWRRVHKINNILYISTPWKCRMEHLHNVKRVGHRHEDPRDCSGRGNTGRRPQYCVSRYLLTIYLRPVPAWLVSPVQYWPVHCTVHSTGCSGGGGVLLPVQLVSSTWLHWPHRHTENKESSDVLLLFNRKYICQRYLRYARYSAVVVRSRSPHIWVDLRTEGGGRRCVVCSAGCRGVGIQCEESCAVNEC